MSAIAERKGIMPTAFERAFVTSPIPSLNQEVPQREEQAVVPLGIRQVFENIPLDPSIPDVTPSYIASAVVDEKPARADELGRTEEYTIYDAIKEVKETCSPEYGAFIQVLQKRGNNISYVSYGLPKEISPEMLERMMTGILYPEPHFQDDVRTTKFANGDLQVLARPGMHVDALDRILTVPRAVLASDHPNHESYSMMQYYKRYEHMQKELPAIRKKHTDAVSASVAQAAVADGIHIHQGAYEWENDTAVGWNLQKTQRFDLLKLAADPEHQEQAEAIIGNFRDHKIVTLVVVDKTKTVGDCDASCSKYFEMKAKLAARNGGYYDPAEAQMLAQYEKIQLTSQQEHMAANMYGGKARELVCDLCGHVTCECFKPWAAEAKETKEKEEKNTYSGVTV